MNPTSTQIMDSFLNETTAEDGEIDATQNDTRPPYQYVISKSQVSFLIIMAIFIIICNIVVLLVYHLTSTLRVPMSVFLKSLAYADLWVGVNCALNIGVTFAGGWPYGLWSCKLIGYLLLVVVQVSIMSLTCISIERYVAIRNPLHYRSLVTYKRARICVTALWIVSCILFMPAFFNWGMDVNIQGQCTLFWRYNVSFGFFIISILIMPNLLISIICYAGIIHTLVARKRWLRTSSSMYEGGSSTGSDRPHARQRQQDKLMAKIGLAVMSAFYITWLPYVACSFLRFLNLAEIPRHLYNGALYLGISNSLLNCIIYSISHQAFRDGFKSLMKRCATSSKCSKTKQTESTQGSLAWSSSTKRTTSISSQSTNLATSTRLNKINT